MELPQNLLQNFAFVLSEKKLPTKYGVASKFIANICLCSIRKKTSYQKWSCLKIYCKHKIFLTPVYIYLKYSKRFRFTPSFSNSNIQISDGYISISNVKLVILQLILCHKPKHVFEILLIQSLGFAKANNIKASTKVYYLGRL